jgi:dolichol-phosphate mannosyltransferase
MERISIIVPTLNEAGNIYDLFERIFRGMSDYAPEDYEVVVVDDDSTDGTRSRIQDMHPACRIRLLHRRQTRGLASAILEGAKAASGEVVVVMDADLSHPPESIPDLLRPILKGEMDMVIGSRYVAGGCTPGWSLTRRLASKLATFPARTLTDIRDPLSGFFAVKKQSLLALDEDVQGFKIGLEILARRGGNIRVQEMPIAFRERNDGASKLNLGVMLDYGSQLAGLAGGNISRKTGVKFGLVGIIGMVVDFALFHLLFILGSGLGTANTLSFSVAVGLNYVLNDCWAFASRTENRKASTSRALLFLSVALLALIMRGGILALLVQSWHWPVSAALFAAIGAAATINYLGSGFLVFPLKTHRISPEVRWRALAVGIVGYTFLLRLIYLGMPELLQEEAYYWNYGQHLALSYLDHPPLLAWLVRGSTELLGASEWGVRLIPFLAWIVTAVFVSKTTKAIFGRSTVFMTLILVSFLPAFFCTGFLSTPDALLLASWSAVIFFAYRALILKSGKAWYGLGMSLGLGMLSKYTIALLVPGLLGFLLMDRSSREWFCRPEPYLAAGLALILFSPVLIWNINHNWASFIFQGPRRFAGNLSFSLDTLLGNILLLLTPTGLLGAGAVIWNRTELKKLIQSGMFPDRTFLLTMLLTGAPLAVFFFFSLFREVKLNWTAPIWLAVLPFIAQTMMTWSWSSPGRLVRVLQKAWPGTIMLTTLALGVVLYYSVLGIPGVPYFNDKPFMFGWEGLGRHIEAIEESLEYPLGKEPLVVGLDKYRIASGLAFYRTKALETPRNEEEPVKEGVHFTTGRHLFSDNSLMYAYWFPTEKAVGRNMVLVSGDREYLAKNKVILSFQRTGPIRSVELNKNEKTVKNYYYRVAEGYRPMMLSHR